MHFKELGSGHSGKMVGAILLWRFFSLPSLVLLSDEVHSPSLCFSQELPVSVRVRTVVVLGRWFTQAAAF